MEMWHSLSCRFSLIYSDIESLCTLRCQFVLNSLKDFPELTKFLDGHIAQPADMPIWNDKCVSNVDRVFVIHSEERPSSSQYWSVISLVDLAKHALSNYTHLHR